MPTTSTLTFILAILLSFRAIAVASVLTYLQFMPHQSTRRRQAKLETSFIYHTATAVLAWLVFAN